MIKCLQYSGIQWTPFMFPHLRYDRFFRAIWCNIFLKLFSLLYKLRALIIMQRGRGEVCSWLDDFISIWIGMLGENIWLGKMNELRVQYLSLDKMYKKNHLILTSHVKSWRMFKNCDTFNIRAFDECILCIETWRQQVWFSTMINS